MSSIVNGIDLDLLLEDLALTKRRVSTLEDEIAVLKSSIEAVQVQRITKSKPFFEDPINTLVGIQSFGTKANSPRRSRG